MPCPRRRPSRPFRTRAGHLAVLAAAFVGPSLAVGAPVPSAAASAVPQAEVIARGDPERPAVAITLDAGSDAGHAAEILATLRGRALRVSFGITGRWAEQNPGLVRQMASDGHHVVNHTYDHRSFTGRSTSTAPLTAQERALELTRADQVIAPLIGRSTKPWFRPPYGDLDASVLEASEASGYGSVAMWTIDSLGWKGLTAEAITARVVAALAPGAVVLMHVGSGSLDAAALPSILDAAAARGLRVATLPDVLRWRPFPNARTLVDGVVRDVLGRAATAAEREGRRAELLSGQLRPADLVAALLRSSELDAVVPPVVRLYLVALGRTPDAPGLSYWAARVRGGAPLEQIAGAFGGTPEFTARFDASSDEQYVRSLYTSGLGRQPDPGGLAYWLGRLGRGDITRVGVLLAFADSGEVRGSTAFAVEVIDAYWTLLGRPPEPTGLAYWATARAGGLASTAFLAAVLDSPEYAARIR